ncbi:MAG: tetratricopeptide repeat protein [Candidatus Aminicenantes bacterium]|nr:tetratricopeptide repeat protein [Candidatus Aminicenantes bacterium]NIM85126.1 tetratricopeptide repeat protein [Candidatus Aminicenantes bacterium]NIN24636.1 tetratricopeptide repeat protein [Candidatus Aminicenantes bacterium]NIN48397.1 tetratricopeptide repeat protein [Candidatus Aminicenantes bacterium]NIN91300.1 tetratricopeptide repeat protein [Candidatus Aminicenantes bacterium]
MKKQIAAVLLILWATCGGTAQVHYTHKLKGRITYLNSGFKPVVGAQVTAEQGANADQTNNQGEFTLVFHRKEAGVDVRLQVTLGKLVVVNEKELSVTLKKDEEKEIKLFMCEKSELDELRATYYDISIANITRRFREESERLRKENKLSREAIARLERDKQGLLEQARELADRFARVNFDDISALRREAFEYFRAGDIKKAIEALDFETMVENIDKAEEEFSRGKKLEKEGQKRQEKAKEQRLQGIEGLLDKARFCRLDFQFDLAKKCYEEAVKKDPDNFDATWELADFLYDQNQFIEARPYYKKLPSLADTEANRVVAFNDLGNLYQKSNQFQKSLQAYSEALKISKKLAEKNPDAFLQYVAITLNNLGQLYRVNNQFTEAFEAYSEVLKIYKQLAKKNPDAFLQYVATTQNNLGLLYQANNQSTEALQAYSEALNLYKQLAEKNPDAFLPDVAMTQNNLGLLYLSQNRLEEAREILIQAVTTQEQLTAKNPRAFEIDLCGRMIALGGFVHLRLLVKTEDLTHLEKADSLMTSAINRLKKYPEVPRATKYLNMAQDIKQKIDKVKEILKKLPADNEKERK